MARRLNFTGRRKINQSDVAFQLVQQNGSLRFWADLRLTGYELDTSARVHVEAYRSVSTLWKRFDFGVVAAIAAPSDLSLDEFGHPEGVLFRVKISAEGEHQGRLLAEADRVRPKLPDEQQHPGSPIIETDAEDLGSEPWRVDFSDDMPRLLIDKRIEDWRGLARDQLFRSLVAPAVMRTVLTQILVILGDIGDEEDAADWRGRWLRFAESLSGVSEHPEPLNAGDDLDSRPDISDWINSAVGSFSQRAQLLDKFIQIRNAESTR